MNRIGRLGVFGLIGMAVSCQQKNSPPPQASPLVVPVAYPLQRKVTDTVDFTGRTEAKNSVSLRPRVTGLLKAMPFREGAEVKEGDLLFKIDASPYQALFDQAKNQVVINEAAWRQAEKQLEIDTLAGKSVSELQIIKDRAAVDEAKARIELSKATLQSYQFNLEWTNVTAPITGRISRYYYTPGNTAIQNQTILTTIVGMDPMYAYFNVDQRTRDRYLKALSEASIPGQGQEPAADNQPSGKPPQRPVKMQLEGEADYPWIGDLDFMDNQINPTTGTVSVRGVFKNRRWGVEDGVAALAGGPARFLYDFPRSEGGSWQIVPGMFVRIRLLIGQPKERLLVIDRAIGSDQGLKFVYIVDQNNTVQYRRVVTGALQQDGLRVIEPYDEKEHSGLKPDDRVVVGSLPQLRPATIVTPDQQEKMPSNAVNEGPAVVRSRPQPPPPGEKTKK